MRPLSSQFRPYGWALSAADIARRAGIATEDVLRFDGNTPPDPPPWARPETIAAALERIQSYRHGGYPELLQAIADYNGVEPSQIVLGSGADDLLMLCARAFAGPGDVVAIAHEPSYPLYRVAVWVTGADVGGDDPVLTFVCRPHNPTGALVDLPDARPLVVDEAYFEYAGETALPLLHEGVIVVRTFSKAFGLASARIGYALADADTARELNARQAPCPVTSLSAALALAALESPPDVAPVVEERERLARALRALGLEPLPSHGNFLFVPVYEPRELFDKLLRQGRAVRPFATGVRISVLDRDDDDVLVEALARVLARASPVAAEGGRRVRRLRATAETRIRVRLALDGASRVHVATGTGLYDHFLEQLAFHAGFNLILEGAGDVETGEHHTAEDAALALGDALDAALGDRRGIARYGDAVVPMDDALARAAVDLGGRRAAEVKLERDPGLAVHMLSSLAQAARIAIHVESSGRDEHHVAEAAFKAVGRALRVAVKREGEGIPSTKGVM